MRRTFACTLIAAMAIASPILASEPPAIAAAQQEHQQELYLQCLARLKLAAAARERSMTPICLEDVAQAKAKAAAEGKPLCVWVGGCDKDARKALDDSGLDAVHCHASAWFGDSTPRLVIPWSDDSCSSVPRGAISPDVVNRTLRLRGTPAGRTCNGSSCSLN